MASRTKCGICLNHYTKPKILPNCYHSFCLECLEQLHANCQLHSLGKPNLVCPACRKQIPVPYGGVKMFQDNFYIEDINPGSCCEIHPGESIKLVCKDCDDGLLCLVCKPTKHENHKCQDIATEAEEKRKIVIEQLNKTETCLKESIEKDEECRQSEDKEYNAIGFETNIYLETLEGIKKQVDELASFLEAEIKKHSGVYEEKRKRSRAQREQILKWYEEALNTCRNRLEHNDHVTFLKSYKDILQSLSKVKPIPCPTTDVSEIKASASVFREWLGDLKAANSINQPMLSASNPARPKPKLSNRNSVSRSHSLLIKERPIKLAAEEEIIVYTPRR